jgi:succinyl-diaminopimelate desuccinylase
MDMKANLVCAIEAFKNTAKQVQYPLALQLVTDEEIGGFKGTLHQVEEGVNAEFVLSTEPTNFDIVHEAKGVMWLAITATGETAHGAYPWRGDNAVETIIQLVKHLQTLIINPTEQKWQSTCNIAGIDTPNPTYNKVPDVCTLRLDIRFVPGEGEQLLESIRQSLPANCSLKILANEPALDTKKDNPFVQSLIAVTKQVVGREVILRGAQGSSDARHFQRVGTQGIEFGPVGEGIGSDDEWVSVASLEQFQTILEQYIRALDTQRPSAVN